MLLAATWAPPWRNITYKCKPTRYRLLYRVVFLFIPIRIKHFNFVAKILLLEMDCLFDLVRCKSDTGWRSNPFVLHIIRPTNDRYHAPCVFLHRLADPQQIHICFFPIGAENMRYIAVVHRVDHIRVLWVMTAKRTINTNIYRFAKEHIGQSTAQNRPNEGLLVLHIVLSAAVRRQLGSQRQL